MPRVVSAAALCCLLSVALASGGCASSYRAEQIVETVQRLCKDEYHYTVSARLDGQTLAVLLQHDGMLEQVGGHVSLSEGANEILGNMIEVLHRVLLSTEAPIQFYVLLVSDRAVPGVYLNLVRYIDDVRRANAQMLAPTEFFSRTLLDLKMSPGPSIDLSTLPLRELRLEQFLSLQLAKRIQSRLAERLQHANVSDVDVGQCEGKFQDGEFTFALNVTPHPGVSAPLDEARLQALFQDATSVIAEVLASYQFDRFTSVRLIHPPTGRTLLLPKTRLDIFR